MSYLTQRKERHKWIFTISITLACNCIVIVTLSPRAIDSLNPIATIMVILLHKPRSSADPSALPGPSLTSYVFPPSISSSDNLSSFFLHRVPAPFLFQDLFPAPRGQKTTSSGLLPSVSAPYLLFPV